LQHVLTDVAREAARSSGFIRRQRAFDGAQFVQTLVFGWLHKPQATLEELVDVAKDLGVSISPQALSERFSSTAVACLDRVLQAALSHLIASDPLTTPLLARFAAVLLHDSTTITLPDALAERFRGCGGSSGRVAASLKAHLRLELRTGQLEGPLLQDGRAHDRALGFRQRPLAGSLELRDLGFFQLDDLALADRDGRFWLSRLKPKTAVWQEGKRVEMLALLRTQATQPLDVTIQLGATQRIDCRLLAVPVPEQVAEQRRRRLRQEARDKGQTLSAERLAIAGWTLAVTNVPGEQLTLQEAMVLLKLRWQIELLFKLWKSQGQIDQSRGQRPLRVLAELYAKLLGMLIQHWLLLSGCWQAADRSLVKAARLVRAAAGELARGMRRAGKLRLVLRALQQRLAQAGRQTRRQKEPNAYQLLENPSLLVVT
jgi:hypothetical protein